jgi:magnesium transporter
MITVLVQLDGKTRQAETVDPAWLAPGAREQFWVDLESPGEQERVLLERTLGVHELVIEDALSEIHHPKIERYDDLLYLILHGIVAEAAGKSGFVTQDVDFLIGRNYLVTVHHDRSRSIEAERAVCLRHSDVFADGPVGICHRIVDQIVDHYTPEVDRLEARLEKLERSVFGKSQRNPVRELLALKRDIAALRRVTLPQRDAVGRLARREFPEISDKLGYRFRDVFDHLVRLTDEALFLQDRVTGLIDAHLSNQSNRLNQVMKVLTVIATIFMPLTVLTGLYGMNVTLPVLPGGDPAQFWWVMGIMLGVSGVMLWFFRRRRWL